MIFGKTKLELKVGVFVFVGLGILMIFILSIGGVKTWASGYRVKFIFNFANGVKVGAPVRFCGIDVGEVKSINFIFVPEEQRTKVQIVNWIRRKVKIPMDSTIWVNTLGLLGEKYIEIMPGKDYTSCLAPNQSLVGIDPLAMHEIVRLAKGITENINDSITKIKNKEGTLGKLLYDDALYQELEAAIKNKEGTIGRFFYDDSVYKEVEALVADIRKHPWKLFWKTKEEKK